MDSRWKLIARYALALTAGILTAVLLVAGYTYLEGWNAARVAQLDGGELLIPLDAQVGIAASFSIYYGVIIIVFCVPAWLWFIRRNLANVWAACALGYVATGTLWIMINMTGRSTVGDLIVSGFPYATCGAIAGLVTWCARPRVAPNVR